MRQLIFPVAVVTVVSLFAVNHVGPASGQANFPAGGSSNSIGIGQTRAVLETYLAALLGREDIALYFADDVVLRLVEIGQEIEGRDAVAGAIEALHEQTFDAQPEVVSLVVDDGTAAVEAVFVGTHTGEVAGIPATGRQVRAPYTVFYDLSDGKISALRIYGFASGLVAQLTAEVTPAP